AGRSGGPGTPRARPRATRRGSSVATARARAAGAGRSRDRRCWGSTPAPVPLRPPPIEAGALRLAVEGERAGLAGCVGTDEDPVLPGGETAEDLGGHGLGPGEAVAGLHAGERVGAQGSALLDGDAQLFLEIDVVRKHGREPELSGPLRVDRSLASGRDHCRPP